jgi:hypothetical protein
MKTLLLFRGTCGSGKTTLRKQLKLKRVKGVDMGDIPFNMPISERVAFPAEWLKKNNEVTSLWIEGIFAPGSPSLESLLREAERQKRTVNIITTSVNDSVLKQRLKGQHNRLDLALKYSGRFRDKELL